MMEHAVPFGMLHVFSDRSGFGTDPALAERVRGAHRRVAEDLEILTVQMADRGDKRRESNNAQPV